KPFPDKIRELVAKVFGTGTVEPLASGDPTQLMQAENAKVLVVNGSGVNGAAQTTFDYLKSQGVNVVNFGNIADYPDAYAYPPLPSRTMIIVHAGKPYVMKYLMSLMKFNSQSQIVVKFDPNASADIVLVVGADYVNAIPGQ
ncbi:MAG TPA: LytR C-terminal domain-containing protein, partial [Anaerolineales bacterium]|nr:LytR C-terminal domain-containing protein [Anaerolineales bacterium]